MKKDIGRYTKIQKVQTIMTKEDFAKGINGHFIQREHKGFVVLLYYTGIRSGEALRSTKEQFIISKDMIQYEVGKRLKHGIQTPPLQLPKSLPFMEELTFCIENSKPKERVWKFSKRTAYNIVTRAFPFYPHYFRLNRITNLFLDKWGIAEVRTWTGLTMDSLNAYVGIANIKEIGKTLS